MTATGWLIGRHLRRRWATVVIPALIVALGTGSALIALGAAVRTDGAYDRYRETAGVGDVVINPSLSTSEIDRVIRHLPGVTRVARSAMLLAALDDAPTRTVEALDADPSAVLVRGATEGRFVTVDRPALAEGRLPSGAHEAVVTVDVADQRGIAVGDVIPLSFWSTFDDFTTEPDAVVTALGVEHVTVVGIGTLADEVLPDRLYPRGQVLVSADVAEAYDCLPDLPRGDATFEEAVTALLPPGCSVLYPYYSLAIDGGRRGVDAALDAYIQQSSRLNEQVPGELREQDIRYDLIASSTADVETRVERAAQPTVAALWVLALGGAVTTVVVLALFVVRELRRSQGDQEDWWRAGMTSGDRAMVAVVPLIVAVSAGIVGAVLVAWWASPVAPLGTMRVVDPTPGRMLSAEVVAAAALIAAVVLVVGAAVIVRATHRIEPDRLRRPPRSARRILHGSGRPEVDAGLRAALGGRRGGLAVTSGGVAAGAFVAALVFAASLSHVVSTPAAYGWPWDLGMMGGFGYGSLDLDVIEATLDDHPDVARWTGLAFGTFSLDGQPLATMVDLGREGDAGLTVVDGRLPRGADEVAIGSRTAADRGIDLGDEAQVSGDAIEQRRVRVSGIVAFPAIGPYQADRADPGDGLLLSGAAMDPVRLASLISFVGIDVTAGVDPEQVRHDLHDDFIAWSLAGDVPVELPEPLRPPEITNAASMRVVPLLAGALLALIAAVSLSFTVGMSVRSRRLEMGVLRALGFTGRQLRRSVRVQALATTLAALLVGLPLGVVVGRLAWRAFAAQLGVVADPSTPLAWVAATVVAGLAIAVVTGALPARAAADTRAAAALRDGPTVRAWRE